MKYTKTAAALALAGIVAAPMAQADVTLTGYLGIGIVGSDADDIDEVVDATGAVTTAASQPGELNMFSDDSTINVRASGTLDNGLEGYANYRTDFGLSNGGGGDGDNIHLGMKGDFGDIRIGEVPDALEYGQVANDILKDIGGEERGVSYTGSFGGATVGLNWSPPGTMDGAKAGGGTDKIAAGVKFSAGGFGIGVGFANANDLTPFSVGATFALGGASIGLAYKDDDAGGEYISAQAKGSFSGASIGLTYEADQGDGDDSKIRFDAGYNLGGGLTISTRVNVTDAATDVTDYRLLLSKDF